MVKRYYVITTGAEVGVFYDHWTNIAPLVKHRQDSVFQGAASREEAEELFEQAKAKGHVHVFKIARPTSSPMPISSRQHTGSMGRTSSNSGSVSDNLQRSKHAERSKLPGTLSTPSQGHRHVYNNTSPYIPIYPKFSRANSGSYVQKLASTETTPRSSLSRTFSEPNHQVHISAEDSFDAFRVHTPSRNPNGGQRQIVATVDSPPWLASYPEDEEEDPLSPTVLPPMLGPSKSEPASTSSRRSSYYGTGKGIPASECGRDLLSFHSPKPDRQSMSSSRSPRARDSSSSNGSNDVKLIRANGTNARGSTASRSGTPSNLKQTQEMVESMSELMTTVGRLVNDLRVQLEGSPPVSRSGSSSVRSRGSSLLSPTYSIGHPRTVDKQQPVVQTPNQSHHSLLFSQDVSSSTRHTLQLSTPCRYCHGTGCDSSSTSVLDQTGLIQPSLGPYHSHNSTEDPRSPFTSSKTMGIRGSIPVTLGRPSPMLKKETLSMQLSPLLMSPRKRK